MSSEDFQGLIWSHNTVSGKYCHILSLDIGILTLLGCSVDIVTRKALKPRIRDSVVREALRVS